MEQVGGEYHKIKAAHTHEGQVLRVTLFDPPGNVLDSIMMEDLIACLERYGRRRELKAIVLTGEGKHFSFGASVEEHQKAKAPSMIHAFHGLFKRLLDLCVPTIALVRGQCLGGGMEVAAFCNFIIAEPSAQFGQPEITLGVFPPVAALILPEIVGQARADDLVLTGASIDAAAAREWGLVREVAENGETALAELLAKRLLPKSAEALRQANRASRIHRHERLGEDLDKMEKLYVDVLMETEDANEGIASFLEKRQPNWKNR